MKYLIGWVLRTIPRKYLQRVSGIVLKSMDLFYRGNKVECPICEKTYRKFLPYGRINPRENALCPGSQSLERHRLMWLYLKEKTDFFTAPHKLLHIAPESCFIKKFEALPNITYTTADLESPLAKVKMEIHAMPFADNSFDIVFCNHVMEHVEDDLQAMREIYRVLSLGGWAIIQSPINESLATSYEDASITSPQGREKAFGQDDHLRMYGRDYPERLRAAGFEVVEDRFVMEMSPEKVARYALPANEIIYLCKKV
ncbi:MAG: class I SAM-dependent methyltransferase [Thermonemataceae bacterium]